MKIIFAVLAFMCLSSSLVVGINSPLPAQTVVVYNLFGDAPIRDEVKESANRLLVISEPSYCQPCRDLEPHLAQLKKEGYDVHVYTAAEWKKAKPKPSNLPKKVKSGKYGVPTVMYVDAHGTKNKVIRHHNGGKNKTAAYIKKYLTK